MDKERMGTFDLDCAEKCPFRYHCGRQVENKNPDCVSNIMAALPRAENLDVMSRSGVNALNGYLTIGTIYLGRVTDLETVEVPQ